VAPRTQRWQFYNDATVIGDVIEEGRSGDYKHTRKHREVLHTRRSRHPTRQATINLDNPENFTTLQNFIEDNPSPLAGYSFKLDLASYTDQNQVPFEGTCTARQQLDRRLEWER
jgi:hypothetical protein